MSNSIISSTIIIALTLSFVNLTVNSYAKEQYDLSDSTIQEMVKSHSIKKNINDPLLSQQLDDEYEKVKSLKSKDFLKYRKYQRLLENKNDEKASLKDSYDYLIQVKINKLYSNNKTILNLNETERKGLELDMESDNEIKTIFKQIQSDGKNNEFSLFKNLFGTISADAITTNCANQQFYSNVQKSNWNYVYNWSYPTWNGDIRNGSSDWYCDYKIATGNWYMNYVGAHTSTGQCVLNQFPHISSNNNRHEFVFGSVRASWCNVWDSGTMRNQVAFRY